MHLYIIHIIHHLYIIHTYTVCFFIYHSGIIFLCKYVSGIAVFSELFVHKLLSKLINSL